MYQLTRFAALGLAIGVVVGCGAKNPAPSYANVSGTVTYNGKPLEKGIITFATDGRQPTIADIVDGKYTGQAMVGSNKVSIGAYRKATKERKLPATAQQQYKAYQEMNKGGGGGTLEQFDPSMEDYIPEDYGKASKQIRVVEAGAPNVFDFNIKDIKKDAKGK
jgi:hypothetical protein